MPVNFIGNFLKLPKLPVAGLWLRILAHVIDWILILSALHIFSRAIPQVYFALGPWAPYLNSLFAFLYFVLFNGPFGKGRTLGKLILGIRVTDYFAEVISYRQSLIRTTILYPLFITVPLAQVLIGIPRTEIGSYLLTMMTTIFAWAVWLSVFIVIAFNPFKQGLHDFTAKTLVQPGRTLQGGVTFEDLALRVGQDWKQYQVQPQLSGGVTIIMVLALLGYMSHPSQRPASAREIYKAVQKITSEPEFANSYFVWGNPTTVEIYQANSKDYDHPALKVDDTISSQSLVMVFENNSPVSWDTLLTPEKQEAAARAVAERFSADVFPRMLTQIETSRSEALKDPASTSAVTEADGFLEHVRKHPVILLSSLNHTVRLTPYPFPLQKTNYSYQTLKTFSIGTENNTDEAKLKE